MTRPTLEFAQLLVHLDGGRLGVEELRPFGQPRGFLGHHAGTGGDHQRVVLEGLAAFGLDLVFVEHELLDRVDVEIDAGFEQAGLVAIELVRRHLAEGDIEQTGLVHVPVRGRQHRDLDLASAYFARQPAREIIGDDGAGSTATHD
jgi:hypothetical protein